MYVVCTVCASLLMIPTHILTTYVSVQVERAALRLEGVRYLLEVTGQSGLLSSVQYAALCGWLGLGSATGRYTVYSS